MPHHSSFSWTSGWLKMSPSTLDACASVVRFIDRSRNERTDINIHRLQETKISADPCREMCIRVYHLE